MARQVINNLESAALIRSKLNDNFTELYPLTGQAAPTTATVGYRGQVMFDTNQVRYECTAINNGVYTWTVGSNGGISSVCIPCDGMKGGTALAYQSFVISSYPYIIKKFLNATTNTAYFDICLPQISALSTVRYRLKYIITEAAAPTAAQTTIFTGASGATVTKIYAGSEVQNTIITTDWTQAVAQGTTELLTVTGTYAQNIGILSIEVEYTKG